MTDTNSDFRSNLSALWPRLWRFCLVLTANRASADDLAQAACLRALERQDQWLADTRLDRWVFRIAHTAWLNQLRADRVRRGLGTVAAEDADLIDPSPNAETNLYTSEVLKEVMALSEHHRVTVLLVYSEGFSYRDAAEQLGVPIGTIMSRLAAARGRLAHLRGDVGKVAGKAE